MLFWTDIDSRFFLHEFRNTTIVNVVWGGPSILISVGIVNVV